MGFSFSPPPFCSFRSLVWLMSLAVGPNSLEGCRNSSTADLDNTKTSSVDRVIGLGGGGLLSYGCPEEEPRLRSPSMASWGASGGILGCSRKLQGHPTYRSPGRLCVCWVCFPSAESGRGWTFPWGRRSGLSLETRWPGWEAGAGPGPGVLC